MICNLQRRRWCCWSRTMETEIARRWSIHVPSFYRTRNVANNATNHITVIPDGWR